jgi:GNAT superfamily N-acetyltransferase
VSTVAASPLRDATFDDLAEVTRLVGVLGYPCDVETMAPRLRVWLSQECCGLFVATSPDAPGTLAGLVAAEYRVILEHDPRVEVMAMVVDAPARRTGLGRRLIDHAAGWAASRGVDTLFLRSNIVRPEAHDFYESLGFTRAKTQHVYERAVQRVQG